MKQNGKYAKDGLGFIDCVILIEYEKIQKIILDTNKPMNLSYPKDRSVFEIEKLSSEPIDLIPIKHNYVINYIGEHNENRKIYLKINPLQVFRLKWIKKIYWIQKTDNWMRFIIPVITSIITYFITKGIYCD